MNYEITLTNAAGVGFSSRLKILFKNLTTVDLLYNYGTILRRRVWFLWVLVGQEPTL